MNLPQGAPKCATIHGNLKDLNNLSQLTAVIDEDICFTPNGEHMEAFPDLKSDREIAMESLQKIYKRYIDSREAALQVNISWSIRKQLEEIFKEKDVNKLAAAFEKAMSLFEMAVIEISVWTTSPTYSYLILIIFSEDL